MRKRTPQSVVLAGLLVLVASCGTEARSQPSVATDVQAVESVELPEPGVDLVADLPTIPVFTVEDLARHSDVVVIVSAGRLVEELQFRPDPNGPERAYAIVEFGVDEVLGAMGGLEGHTVAVWLPQSVVASPDLPGRYVLFLRRVPGDFDATAAEHLAQHTNPAVLVPGFNSIMEIADDIVTVPSAPFYGLASVDARPGAPFAPTFALDEVRAVVKPAVGRGAAETAPDERTAADAEWLQQRAVRAGPARLPATARSADGGVRRTSTRRSRRPRPVPPSVDRPSPSRRESGGAQ